MHGARGPAEAPPDWTLRAGAAGSGSGQAEGSGHGLAWPRRLPGQGVWGRAESGTSVHRPPPCPHPPGSRCPSWGPLLAAVPMSGANPAEHGWHRGNARR